MTGKNRIMIYGPKGDGAYVVEFRTADGDVLSISIPRTRGPCDSVLPGADALRAVRAGRISGGLADPVVRRLAYHCPAGPRAAAYARHHPRPQTRRPGIAAS